MSPSIADHVAMYAMYLPAFLAAISFHEFLHAYVAHLCGDDTAKRMGRMTVNPIVHIDFFGLICLLLFGIGWAKPVSTDSRNLKYPRLSSILISLAGPLANFLLALIFLYALKYFPFNSFSNPAIAVTFDQIFKALVYVNISLGVFNLLPIPPLDGSHLITTFLFDKYPRFFVWLYQYSFIILILLISLPQTRMFLMYLIKTANVLLRSLVF